MKRLFNQLLRNLSKIDISVLFFLMFVFCLPFFKRISIYTDFSFLDGRFVDYLTYSVYAFDFFLSLVFIAWLFEIIFRKETSKIINWKADLSYFGVIIFSLISVFAATERQISFYYVFILVVIWLIFTFVKNRMRNRFNVFLFLNTFVATMLLQSILAVMQFIKNGSIGLSILGEQIISPKIAGVAKIMFGSIKHIRPYGTFSHPNILALFLVVAGLILLHLLFNYKDRIYKTILYISFLLVGFALFLTFSRALWLLAFISWGAMIYGHYKSRVRETKRVWPYFLLALVLVLASAVYFFPAIAWRVNPFNPVFWQSFNDRMLIFGKAWIMAKSHFMGIGVGNFVIEEAYLLTGYPLWMAEPVHNTYFLILAEIGWLGLLSFLSFIYFLGRGLKKVPIYLACIFFVIIVYMLFDHCFWDIRQAQVLMMIFFGLISAHSYSSDKQAE